MIVRFSLTPESVHLNGVDPDKRTRLMRTLVHSWGKTGRLMALGGDAGLLALLGEVDKLPVDLRKMWKRAIKKYRLTPVSAQCPTGPGLEPGEVAALSAWLEVLGCEQGRLQDASYEKLEVVGVEQLTMAEAFVSALEMADENLYEDTATKDIWEKKVAPLFQAATNITVVDRYSFASFMNCPGPLENLGLTHIIDATAKQSGKNVKIYGSLNDNPSDGTVAADLNFSGLREKLNGIKPEFFKNPRSRITFQALPEKAFSKCHDRYLVFDYQVLEVGIGLDFLRGPKLYRGTTLSLKARASTHEEILRQLTNASSADFRIDWEAEA